MVGTFLADAANVGLVAVGAGIAMISAGCSSIGEGMIASKAIEGMYRNPEMANKLRSNMIVGIALDETCGIYSLLVAILIIFVLGGN